MFPVSFFTENRRDYNWSKKEIKTNTVDINPIFEELSLDDVDMEIDINQSNILEILSGRLSLKYDEETIDECVEVLKEVI